MLIHVLYIFHLFLHVTLILFYPYCFYVLHNICIYFLRYYLWVLLLDKYNKIFKLLLLFCLRLYNIFYCKLFGDH